MALPAKEIAGKVLAIFFPIMAFVALGYEHCIANTHFIPVGLLLKGTAASSSTNLGSLTWGNFPLANLLPAAVGGTIFVGTAHWTTSVRSPGSTTGPRGSERGSSSRA